MTHENTEPNILSRSSSRICPRKTGQPSVQETSPPAASSLRQCRKVLTLIVCFALSIAPAYHVRGKLAMRRLVCESTQTETPFTHHDGLLSLLCDTVRLNSSFQVARQRFSWELVNGSSIRAARRKEHDDHVFLRNPEDVAFIFCGFTEPSAVPAPQL